MSSWAHSHFIYLHQTTLLNLSQPFFIRTNLNPFPSQMQADATPENPLLCLYSPPPLPHLSILLFLSTLFTYNPSSTQPFCSSSSPPFHPYAPPPPSVHSRFWLFDVGEAGPEVCLHLGHGCDAQLVLDVRRLLLLSAQDGTQGGDLFFQLNNKNEYIIIIFPLLFTIYFLNLSSYLISVHYFRGRVVGMGTLDQ